ncbi:MAG TPA: exodeoxyribonuclease I [Candidatus Saccharimonadales bacterium]|nr:exodeoxyribonuclease I [Candidatus Saccharimonadales bacterium]
MADSFFFYDLETTGISPRSARVMQFAGQRTDMDLNPLGEPFNLLIRLTPDVLPEPEAILLTGITPQKTLAEGYTEAEFLKIFYKEVVLPGTVFTGFNSVRFDDEFMRFLNFRNFYDAYEWQWKEGNSRWDILDLARMTRALRPEGINWPVGDDGGPSARLEHLTKANHINHLGAHDALADVRATISVARLIKEKQPELFKYLFSIRDKKSVAAIINKGLPAVLTSRHFSPAFYCTSVVAKLLPSPNNKDAAIVYDLRYDPEQFVDMGIKELEKIWEYQVDPEIVRLPVHTLKYNRVPALAPLGVIKQPAAQERIGLDLVTIHENFNKLTKHRQTLSDKVLEVVRRFDEKQKDKQASEQTDPIAVDAKLYDGFIQDHDRQAMAKVRQLKPAELSEEAVNFHDDRLKALLPLYKARNYPKYLDNDERLAWEQYCNSRLTEGGKSSRLAAYFEKLNALASKTDVKERLYLLEELQLYGQSLIPAEESDSAYR